MANEPSDETQQLLLAAKQGDEAAVNELLDRHRAPLRRMIESRLDPALGRRVDASDIVQEAMVEAHRRLRDFLADGRMPFHLWLRCLARDRIIDAHRRHRVARRRSIDREQAMAGGGDSSALDGLLELPAHDITPAAAALRAELQSQFDAALAALNDADREVVLMRHVEQLANHEVAELLGISPPAAAMRYLRAVRRLRGELGGADASTGDDGPANGPAEGSSAP